MNTTANRPTIRVTDGSHRSGCCGETLSRPGHEGPWLCDNCGREQQHDMPRPTIELTQSGRRKMQARDDYRRDFGDLPNVRRVGLAVTLTGSDNEYLTYPCEGIIDTAEFAVDGRIIWATFRRQQEDGGFGAKVSVRNATFTTTTYA